MIHIYLVVALDNHVNSILLIRSTRLSALDVRHFNTVLLKDNQFNAVQCKM